MIYDENNIPTGEYTTGYDTPAELCGTFSTASGRATEREFGTFIDYDYVIHIEEETCPFDENAGIWMPGTNPYKTDGKTLTDPDAKVVRIAEPTSYTAIAVKKIR